MWWVRSSGLSVDDDVVGTMRGVRSKRACEVDAGSQQDSCCVMAQVGPQEQGPRPNLVGYGIHSFTWPPGQPDAPLTLPEDGATTSADADPGATDSLCGDDSDPAEDDPFSPLDGYSVLDGDYLEGDLFC